MTGNGGPALVLDADIETKLAGGGVGTGIAYPVTAGAAFAGNYGLEFTQNLNGTLADTSGEMSADAVLQTLSGTVDTNSSFTPQPPTPLSGSFLASTVAGRLDGILSNQNFPADLAVAFYPVDSSRGFFVENDGGSSGTNPGNLTFGYYETRTPVCPGCP